MLGLLLRLGFGVDSAVEDVVFGDVTLVGVEPLVAVVTVGG